MLKVSAMGNYSNLNVRNNRKQKSNSVNFTQNSESKSLSKVDLSTLQAYNNIPFGGRSLGAKFITPNGKLPVLSYLKEAFNTAQKKLSTVKEYSAWRDLPEQLLKNNSVNEVYDTVEKFKAPFGKDSKLIFIGLGNPANADEAANVLGLGHKVTHCIGTTKGEARQAINNAGGNLDKIQVIISSKSGTTFESNEAYKLIRKQLVEHYKAKSVEAKDMDKEISKHFLCLTDKNPEATLKKVAIQKGYATIDCIDGLPSGFGDLAYDMPVLAYVGVPRETMTSMLQAADKMNKKLLKTPFEQNLAGQMAAFDKFAIDNGATKEQFIFHSSIVSMPSTIKQLYEESLRKVNLGLNTFPRGAHSSLEASISQKLPNQPISIITDVTTTGKPQKSAYLEASLIKNIQKEGHFQKIIKFPLAKNGETITPESFAEFLVLKSHLAFYKNELEGLGHNLEKIDYVKGYKADFGEFQKSKSPITQIYSDMMPEK